MPFSLPNLTDFVLTVPVRQWPRVLGIVLLGATISNWIISSLRGPILWWAQSKEPQDKTADYRTFALLGFVESLMYPLAAVAGHVEFVAVWLAFKAVSVWQGHAGEVASGKEGIDKQFSARRRYKFYLFNNALRLLLASGTYAAFMFWGS